MTNPSKFIVRAAVFVFAWIISSSLQAATYNIYMTAYGFQPSYLEVTVGDRVYWWNDDYDYFDYHSTRSYTYPWSSGPVDVGFGVYLDTTKTGTYTYTDDWGLSGSGTLVIKPAGPPPPPTAGTATLISAPGCMDMVYDQGRDILYITSGSTVLRYQLASDSFLDAIQLSGNLMGIDLSPDGNTLMVADSSASSTNVWVHVVDLTTGKTNRAFFPSTFYESGTFAVAFGGDGAAVISSRFAGSGWVPLRRYNPISGEMTVISTFIRHDSMVSGSGDGTTIVVAESDISGGETDIYDVASRSIIRTGGTGHFNYECGASRDASLFAFPTYYGTFVYDRNLNQLTNIGVYAGEQPIGAAFHPAADVVFFPFATTAYVRAYSTSNWTMLAQYDFGSSFTSPGNKAFNNGRIRISPDGQIIFATVPGGVAYVRHNLDVPLTHRLALLGAPRAYGTPTPLFYGTYWLPDGTNLTLSVPTVIRSNGVPMICIGWVGTGSAVGSGSGTDVSFTLTANTTVTWNWTIFGVSANVVAQLGGKQMTLQWPSIAGMTYDVLFATNVQGPYTAVATDLPATPPNNSYGSALGSGRTGFYKVNMK